MIEDYLHILVDSCEICPSDKPILSSISTQCKKGIGLTDRQYNLILSKIPLYKDQFKYYNEDDLKNTRVEIRTIDRSKYITISSTPAHYLLKIHELETKWIKIRFPFSKKDIVKVDALKISRAEYHHLKGTHEHYFRLTANNCYQIVTSFQNRNFEIDADLIKLSNKTVNIINRKNDYIPFTKNGLLYNVNESVQNYVESIVINVELNKELIYADRSILFNYEIPQYTPTTLTERIAFRTNKEVTAVPGVYEIQDIVNSLVELNRFPIVVLVDEEAALEQVSEVFKELCKHITPKEQAVLFRVDNNTNVYNLNNFVHDNLLNNWVDISTKVVYIKKNKLPKLLINSEFKPITALAKSSLRNTTHVDTYVNFNCDLVIYNDEVKNMFSKWSKPVVYL